MCTDTGDHIVMCTDTGGHIVITSNFITRHQYPTQIQVYNMNIKLPRGIGME